METLEIKYFEKCSYLTEEGVELIVERIPLKKPYEKSVYLVVVEEPKGYSQYRIGSGLFFNAHQRKR